MTAGAFVLEGDFCHLPVSLFYPQITRIAQIFSGVWELCVICAICGGIWTHTDRVELSPPSRSLATLRKKNAVICCLAQNLQKKALDFSYFCESVLSFKGL
jgi:hypothetical protein